VALDANTFRSGPVRINQLSPARWLVAVAAIGLAACGESTTSALASLAADSTVTKDVANSAGDAIATHVESMVANESAAALPGSAMPYGFDKGPGSAGGPTNNALTFTRSRTCYDAAGAVVAGCRPESAVRKIVTLVTMDGSRSGSSSTTGGDTKSWSGAVHRVSNDTLVRNFDTSNPPVEKSRTHSDVSVAHDTTLFSEGANSRNMSEASHDYVNAVTWNLPRNLNPFPISGSIVRLDSVHVVVTKDSKTETKDLVRMIEVDFPADSQGNVVLKIDGKTCTLNLVTHAVANCQ
jgi:hypothetical protein